jgi:hypothetical protein
MIATAFAEIIRRDWEAVFIRLATDRKASGDVGSSAVSRVAPGRIFDWHLCYRYELVAGWRADALATPRDRANS